MPARVVVTVLISLSLLNQPDYNFPFNFVFSRAVAYTSQDIQETKDKEGISSSYIKYLYFWCSSFW